MKFSCSICGETGDISEDILVHPVTRTTCRNCGTILLINPDTGKVDAHKSPLKDSPAFAGRSAAESDATLSMDPQGKDARDWTAVVVVAIIVIILISAGVYFALNLDII
jgi:ribosomal protein S27E